MIIKKFNEYKKILESVSYNEDSDKVKKMQQSLVDLGINIGSFGEKGDGVDGIAGRFTFGGVKVLMDLLKENKSTDISEDILVFNPDKISDQQFDFIISLKGNNDVKQLLRSKKDEIQKRYKDVLRVEKPSRKKRKFFEEYSDDAVEACQKFYDDYGVVIFPSLMLAQSALESGWGRSGLTRRYNNFFGIKADKSWKGKSVKKFTNEYINGKKIRIKQPFRWYDSPKESFYDRNKFLLENKRYKHHGVFKADNPIEQAEALERAGYATEPNYAKKISEDIYKYGLDELDKNIKI
jgi:flagellum-specific peptidoglycan hydrolase FlgJ